MNLVENGKRLRKLRGDMSAQKVSTDIGISESSLLMYERGERNPRDDTKEALAEYYGVSLVELFYPDNIS